MILLESLLIFLLYVIGIIGAIHALMKKREPRAALLWVIICVFFPFFGVLLYIMFGVNRVKMVMREWRSHGFCSLTAAEEQLAKNGADHLADYEVYRALMKTGYHLLHQPLELGCQVDCLFDGVQAYPAMLEAIRGAESCIFLSTYIFGSTGIGAEFVEALADAVKRKVEVKVLIDGVGSLYTWPSIYLALKKRHVPVYLFLFPLGSIRGMRYLNLRNHTKLLVVDGKVAFTGGMNIHMDNDAKPGVEPLIHDLHFRLTGPILGELQDVFLNIWYFATGWKQTSRLLFYDDAMKGKALVRGIANGPYQDMPAIQIMLNAAINQAQKQIRIMTPYFIIGNILGLSLISAVLRGVSVEMILPEKNNLSFVKGATEALLTPLLQLGVKAYYRKGNFAHNKIFIVDDAYVILGSSNLDTRSFALNFEFNVEVYDRELAKQLTQHFDEVKEISHPLTAECLQKQNFVIKLRNAICKLFSPYL